MYALSKKIILTKRDLDLMTEIQRFKVISSFDIRDRFFQGLHSATFYQRIRKLRAANIIIKIQKFHDDAEHTGFSLSEKGLGLLRQLVNGKGYKSQISSNYPIHDMELYSLLNVLSRSKKVKTLITENELHFDPRYSFDKDLDPFRSLKSDAVLDMNTEKHRLLIPVEYERSLKNKDRYEKKINQYREHFSNKVILFVPKKKSIQSYISKVENELASNSETKFYFCSFDSVLNKPNEITFESSDGSIVKL